MTTLATDSTSAAGSMVQQVVYPFLVGTMLVGSGTTSAPTEERVLTHAIVDQTSAGVPEGPVSGLMMEEPSASIAELRRISGLTWEQLARMFGTSRRSLHFWASGKPMSAKNQEHLRRLLAVVRAANCGSASVNRAALVEPGPQGFAPIELLAERQYHATMALLQTRVGQRETDGPTPQVLASRAPAAPGELVGALQDRVHVEPGRVRTAKRVRVRGDG